MLTQAGLIKKFNTEYRQPFNEDLFTRDENDIVNELRKVILSCQKFQPNCTIKVVGFELIEDYEKIMTIMNEYEQETSSKGKKRKRVNTYEYINLKDTDFKLLIVYYFIRSKKDTQRLKVYIQIPRVVNKFYFRISGNLYSAIYQIVDGSTYNNSTSTSKIPTVTFKTTLNVLKIIKYVSEMELVDGTTLVATNYATNVFSKCFSVFKYILAKYGFYQTLQLTGIKCIGIYNYKVEDDNLYVFKPAPKAEIYVTVPKYVFDRDQVTQSLVYAIYIVIKKFKNISYEMIFSEKVWIESLGSEFSTTKRYENGMSILHSAESSILDIKTCEVLKIPDYLKQNIYTIMLWIMREFTALKNKDNVDITTKRVKSVGEYIASLYAMKLTQGLHRLSDVDNIQLATIRNAILIRPSYLMESIVKCNLVNCIDIVDDLDSYLPIRYTFKRIPNPGRQKNKESVPMIFRYIHSSQFGRLDADSSSKGDPGMTGILTPMTKLYTETHSFSDFQESNVWETEFQETMKAYKSLIGAKELLIFKRDVLGENNHKSELDNINESINIMKRLSVPIYNVETNQDYEKFNLASNNDEEGGVLYYDEE